MNETIEDLNAWIIHYQLEIQNYYNMIEYHKDEIEKLKKQIKKKMLGDKIE